MRMIVSVLVIALSSMSLVLSAQTPAHSDSRHELARSGPPDPAARTLALADELDLTSEQIAQLNAIQVEYDEANAPLLEQLRQAMPEREIRDRDLTREERRERMAERRTERGPGALRGERGREWREQMAELRPVFEELRANQRLAQGEIEHVLTADQQAALQAHNEERRQEMRSRLRERRD